MYMDINMIIFLKAGQIARQIKPGLYNFMQ
jgi:hypothetical protein